VGLEEECEMQELHRMVLGPSPQTNFKMIEAMAMDAV
jgi:hypothetical protein